MNELQKSQIKSLIDTLNLDLSGLTVYTEAASGAYLFNPFVALMAGAERVYAQSTDSSYASFEQVKQSNLELAEKLGFAKKFEIFNFRDHRRLRKSDIVTNSNFVRPIDNDLIKQLKPTASLPLMWETWEVREVDFDLQACRDYDIATLGTNEHEPPVDMLPFNGLLALKLIFELGYDCGKVLLLGSPDIFAGPMKAYMSKVGIPVTRIGCTQECEHSYAELTTHFEQHGHEYSFIILAEQQLHTEILGKHGFLSFETVQAINPHIKLGVISGGIDVQALEKCNIAYSPKRIAPGGFMSYQLYRLGFLPVVTLFAGGLKVGERMTRNRLAGMSRRDAEVEALTSSPAMDFPA
ncbi:MAG: hypothetical protein VYD53_10730 [Pseudomonadota bacterium]|uniref:Uncharacterized protein n=1 Tax=Alteromonas oceani TaxID=2071609 RepID=A0ABV7JW22_9ALTE|nr:hypothetical protein [Alteromonas oceani]MEC9261803.1 hypothetical protein [Pseudomonadota bacterium]